MATTDPFLDLLTKFLTTQDQDTSGSQTSNKSGSQTTDTSTKTDTTNQSSTNTTNNSTQSGKSTVQNTADVANLQQILQRQLAGPSAGELQSIFQQGANQIPALATALATAYGARPDSNTGLQMGLADLNTSILSKVADLQRAYLTDAQGTASQIADLTKSQTTTGDQTTTGSTVSDTNGTTNTNTDQSSVTSIDELLKQLMSGQTSNGMGLNGTNIGLTAGVSLLNSLLKGQGGISGSLSSLGSLLGGLFGSGSGSGSGGSLFDQWGSQDNFDWTGSGGGYTDTWNSPEPNYTDIFGGD